MLLVTRPQPSAADTARRLKARGINTVVAPCLAATFTSPRTIDATGHIVIVTSPQAARALASWRALHALPAIAVGDATQALLRQSGFTKTISADGDAVALLRLIAKRYKKQKFLLACAPSTGRALATALRAKGHTVRRIAVYAIAPVATCPAAVGTFLKNARATGVLLYSPRTARTFVTHVKKARLDGCTKRLNAYCLSPAIAKAAKGLSWKSVVIAGKPTEAALFALLPHKGDKAHDRPAVRHRTATKR